MAIYSDPQGMTKRQNLMKLRILKRKERKININKKSFSHLESRPYNKKK
jgi:hypothetical protein